MRDKTWSNYISRRKANPDNLWKQQEKWLYYKYEHQNWILPMAIVCFIIFLTKQNIGIFYFIAIIIFLLVKEKKDKKIEYIIKTSLIFLISCLIFILYLQKNGIFYNFLNYAILRIKPICKRKQLC